MDERLLSLYNTELRHLRESAAEFAREFPKIAERLGIDRDSKDACPDPYVERLLEGFAFLAARVHLKIDAEFPRFTQGLLETVYPDYLCPVPSMCVVRFDPDGQEGSLAGGVDLPRGTVLRGSLAKGERTACTFTTAHPVRLLPLEVSEGRYFTRDVPELRLPSHVQARAAIRIRLKKTLANPFADIRADPVTVYLRGPDEIPVQLFEQIFARKTALVVQSPTSRKTVFCGGPECIRRVGLGPGEAILPPGPRGFEGYRLLKEYFALPQRFLFIELAGFGEAMSRIEGEEFDLVIALSESESRLEGQVTTENFALHCTPAVNLFEKQLDRVLLGDQFSEFHVIPDRNRPLDFEVYRVASVTGYGDTPDDERHFRPFYLARDVELESGGFFTTQRVPRLLSAKERQTGRRSTYAGSDVFISLVDADNAPYRIDTRQLGIRALCTNRHLPIQMSVGGGRTDFQLDVSVPVESVRVVSGPTPPRPSLAEGRFAWRLISHLALNYLSLADSQGDQGAMAFRELLSLYADPNDRNHLKQIDGLRSIRTRPTIHRVPTDGPITFARGLEVGIVFDETGFEGTGVFLLGSVLDQFFARYVSLNSFTETVISTLQRKEIIRWPPQTGTRHLL